MSGRKSSQGYIREVNLGGDFALKIHKGVFDTFLDKNGSIFDNWTLKKVKALDNEAFEDDFDKKSYEFKYGLKYSDEEMQVHYGFLATSNSKMLDVVADEGLRVKSCPINSLGHCVSGVHLNVHGDICLEQAAAQMPEEETIILVAFKFMYGKAKLVEPFETLETLTAPTPNCDSHITPSKPRHSQELRIQHLNSLVYLYEFENAFFHPISRPRQCCPVAALYFQSSRRRTSTDIASKLAVAFRHQPATSLAPTNSQASYPPASNYYPPAMVPPMGQVPPYYSGPPGYQGWCSYGPMYTLRMPYMMPPGGPSNFGDRSRPPPAFEAHSKSLLGPPPYQLSNASNNSSRNNSNMRQPKKRPSVVSLTGGEGSKRSA